MTEFDDARKKIREVYETMSAEREVRVKREAEAKERAELEAAERLRQAEEIKARHEAAFDEMKPQVLNLLEEVNQELFSGKGQISGWKAKTTKGHVYDTTTTEDDMGTHHREHTHNVEGQICMLTIKKYGRIAVFIPMREFNEETRKRGPFGLVEFTAQVDDRYGHVKKNSIFVWALGKWTDEVSCCCGYDSRKTADLDTPVSEIITKVRSAVIEKSIYLHKRRASEE